MLFNKRLNIRKAIFLMISTITSGWILSGYAADTASTDVPITASIKVITCNLEVPDNVTLGSMTPGTQSYPPFSVKIDCPASMNTVLYAQVVSGNLTAGNLDRVDMTGPVTTGIPAQLWLWSQEDAKVITLDGSGNSDSTKGFCSNTTSRSCTLVPWTLVDVTTPRGQTSATIKFSIRYP